MEDDDRNITWRRTFPECAPGTDGVALFGPMATDSPSLIRRWKAAPSAGCGSWQSRERSPGCGASPTALTPTGHGAPDRTLAGAAPAQADLKGAPPGVAGRPASALLGREAVTPHGPKPRTRASELSRRRCLQRSCPSRRRSGTRASRAGLSRGIPGRYFHHCQAFRAGRRHRD